MAAEELEEPVSFQTELNVIAVVLVALVLVSVAFEEGKNALQKRTHKNLLPIIESLFGEIIS